MQLEHVTPFILNKLRKELSSDFQYHNVEHTEDVFGAANDIARWEGVTQRDSTLLSTAALYHDTGFLISPDNHEINSCRLAFADLPNYDYSADEIDQVGKLIMATKVPQEPKNHLQEIICDADLDYLGRADFFVKSEKLYAELLLLGRISSYKHFLQLQLEFLTAHYYFTATANKYRNKQKIKHLNKLKKDYADM